MANIVINENGEALFPEGLTEIGWRTFSYCQSLKKINIPSTITKIGEGAFDSCKNLEEVILPEGLTEIGYGAFKNCQSLKKINISSIVTKIGEYAFDSCKNLEEVILPEGLTEIGYEAFKNCQSLKKINIPNTVIRIGERVFYVCTNLEEVILPEGLTEIGCRTFSNCQSLKKITIPNTVIRIGEFAFGNCVRLENVILPEGLTEIGHDAFSYCKSLKKITIPSTVTKIGECAFDGCKNLEEVIFPEGLTEISYSVFSNCQSLKKITIPSTVTKIGECAFDGCVGLENVILPEGLTEICDHAFKNCQSLKKITIPNTVIRIGERVFNGVSGIIINIKTSLFQFNFLEGLSTPVHVRKDVELIIYNCKITSSVLYEVKWNAIRKTELLDIISSRLIENGIYQKNNYKEHKKIIDEILFYFDNEVKHYDYRNTLESYLEKYIEEHKPANMLVQLNNFANKSISEVTEELKKVELEEITSDSTYIEIFGLGKKMNEYPLYISSIILNTISIYSKDTKIKQLKQTFDKLSSSDKKRNIFQKIFFKSDDNGLVLNEELWNHLNNTINNEIILSSEEIEVLNNIKELISIYVSKLQEYISYLENYSINIDPSLNEFKTNLLPSLIAKTKINDAIGKDISIVKDTIEISRILEELINNEECMNNTFENNQIEEKQLIK